jgi:hypothetical protein
VGDLSCTGNRPGGVDRIKKTYALPGLTRIKPIYEYITLPIKKGAHPPKSSTQTLTKSRVSGLKCADARTTDTSSFDTWLRQ